MKMPCVYILASKRNGTLYVGTTSNLVQRIWQHKHDLVGGFTQRYGVHTLVWYESHATMESAITREEKDQGMEAGVEDCIDREGQSGMARLV